jgi:hypothetical protein
MKRTINFLAVGVFALAVVACKPKYTAPETSAGEINPERLVVIGGSHVGGYFNDGLTAENQSNSVAEILAQQFKVIGGGSFFHPQIGVNSVGISWDGNAPFKLGYRTDCKEETSLGPVRTANSGDGSLFDNNVYSSTSKIGNFGIPRLKMSQLTDNGLSLVNPFFKRMASASNATVLGDINALSPTFFASFMGFEDVIEYARSGGVGVSLPSPQDFESAYSSMLSQLTANGAKGVVATIPDPVNMPFFTTIPWNGLNLAEGDNNITLLNNFYGQLGYSFAAGENGFMAYDEDSPTIGIRQLLPTDKILLSIPLDSVKCFLLGTLRPFRDEHYLDNNEILGLRNTIQSYNTTIRTLANQFGLAVVETDAFFAKTTSGFTYNGVNLTAAFVSGGMYSLDGLNFNPRGNALLANEFIKAINKKYSAKIPQVNAGNYTATLFP